MSFHRHHHISIRIWSGYFTITALERDQYEVLWSRVQQYWTRPSQVQYCCTLPHKTPYWSSSSVVIVLLHKILFVLNFYITYVFQYYNFNIKILKFYENWNFEIFKKFWNLIKILKFWTLNFFLYYICFSIFLFKYLNFEILWQLKFHSLILHESAVWFFFAQKLLYANQYVRKWNVTCIASGQ
jgi:hypothetical protein